MVNYTVCLDSTRWTDSYTVFSQIVNGFLTTLCVVLGSVGNIHSIKAVHFANFDKNRGVVLAVSLLSLALWDTILLWCAFFYYGMKNLTQNHRSDFLNFLTPYFHGCSQIANTASIWCVVSITVQRYMATRDPFRTTRHSMIPAINSFRAERRKPSFGLIYCSVYRRHFKLPLIISAIAIAINSPAFFEIEARLCYRMPEGRLGYGLHISDLRMNPYYKLWYKVIFRMVVTSCGPNCFILCKFLIFSTILNKRFLVLTVLTVLLLKGSNRSRRQLFQMSESLLDRYNSKETMQTMISLMLVIKFLLFRSLSFMLDVWEVTFGTKFKTGLFIYILDISNFLVMLNSATNCLIFLRGSKWLQTKIVQRNTMRRKRQLCIENLQSLHRVNLLFKSWQNAMFMTNRQFGVRILYAMLLKNPQFSTFLNNYGQQKENPLTPNTIPSVPPPTPAACKTTNGSNASTITTIVSDESPNNPHLISVLVMPRGTMPGSEVCPGAINARTAEVVAAMPHVKKRSLDLLGNPSFHDVGDRIMHFMGELINAMRMAQPDQHIIMRIRRVGALHQALGISFPSSAWKEFKSSTLAIIQECDFPTEQERNETLEAWSSFLSVIIREMKMGSSGFGLKA
uniref:G_PROTEIN_RECEP_F1_2 domain-containing protein n=1 Tax=Panagrolaimus sp. JU765 TaxID=591449 RepID=A0AC34RGT1_9BILA